MSGICAGSGPTPSVSQNHCNTSSGKALSLMFAIATCTKAASTKLTWKWLWHHLEVPELHPQFFRYCPGHMIDVDRAKAHIVHAVLAAGVDHRNVQSVGEPSFAVGAQSVDKVVTGS